jgi:RNase P subunit RPR2
VTVPLPTPTTRWRCTSCGNLTRFDVTRTSRVTEFVHLDLAGSSVVEDRTVHSEVVEEVRCRWCDAVDRVELVPRADVEAEVAGRSVEEAARAETRGGS